MFELQFADGVLARLQAAGGRRYDERAYLFVLEAVEALQVKLEVRRHVTGAELSWAVRDLALERFGVLARTVLSHWGVGATADIGRLVYLMVEIGLLSTQPGDREEDFHEVFAMADAFEDYALRWSDAGA